MRPEMPSGPAAFFLIFVFFTRVSTSVLLKLMSSVSTSKGMQFPINSASAVMLDVVLFSENCSCRCSAMSSTFSCSLLAVVLLYRRVGKWFV